MAESSAASVSDALKRLSKTLALGLPVVLLRASCVILSFGIVNLAFAVWVFIYSGMGGHGHAGIVALPLACVPFLPFFVLALLMAHKQGVASVIALAVESQGPTLAAVGEHTMATYLEQNNGALLRESRDAFGRTWQRYLRTRSELPGPVRFLLSRLCARVRIAEVLDELSAKGTHRDDLPRELMSEVIKRSTRTLLRPSRKPLGILLGAKVVWFCVLYVMIRYS